MARGFLAGAVASALTVGTAGAADLPVRSIPSAFAAPPLAFSWTGAYFGVNAGYVFDNTARFDVLPTDPGVAAAVGAGIVPASTRVSADGFTGGGQVGYNYQFRPGSGVVVGLEADAAYTDLDARRSVSADGAPIGLPGVALQSRSRSQLDYLGTVRGRAGYAFDRLLVYATGGFAYGAVNSRFDVFVPPLAPGAIASANGDRMATGYAVGGGIEYALAPDSLFNVFRSSAVTVKAEYLHYDLGRSAMALRDNTGVITGVAGAQVGTIRVRTAGDLARVGLNYKFGSY